MFKLDPMYFVKRMFKAKTPDDLVKASLGYIETVSHQTNYTWRKYNEGVLKLSDTFFDGAKHIVKENLERFKR